MPHAPDLAGCALDGRYELHELIGEGTFGRVYRGYDRRLARSVAIKVIKPWWGEDPEWAESFEREAQLLARVSDPGIVQIYDVGQADEGLYYVTELVDGESLAARLRRGRLPVWEACEIAEQLCRALEHAHAEQVVHRDIKPANVLISARGSVKVGDLGIARLAEGTTEGGTATIVGTPKYMAPEQANGLPATPATDVYSAGIVLYEMLAGRAPFRGGSPVEIALRHVQEPPPPLDPSVPEPVVRVVHRALEKDPVRRYQSAGEMADALARARAGADAFTSVGNGSATDDGGATLIASRAGADRSASATWVAPRAGADRSASATWVAPRAGADRSAGATSVAPGLGANRSASATWVAPRFSARRTVNPAARRRNVGLLALVLLLLVGMAIAPIILSAKGTVRLPGLRGLSQSGAAAKLHHLGLRASFAKRTSSAREGIVIQQNPTAGATVKDGSAVQVVVSAGPPPIPVPQLVGQSSGSAAGTLAHDGLRSSVDTVPAPGVTPGVVVRQSPTAGHHLLRHQTVRLYVAETPQWRDLTSFAGSAGGNSVPFRIRGTQWRIVYHMSYQGTCNFVFFCNGPSVQVMEPTQPTLPANVSFDLKDGGTQTRVVQSGAGVYQIEVKAGWDSARWSIQVQDYW